jgi:hypothetical protein
MKNSCNPQGSSKNHRLSGSLAKRKTYSHLNLSFIQKNAKIESGIFYQKNNSLKRLNELDWSN